MSQLKSAQATLFGATALLFWSLSAVLANSITALPTFEILSIILGIGFLLSFVKVAYHRDWSKLNQPLAIWVIGIVGIYGNDLLYIAAFKYAPAAEVDLINYLWPIFVILLSGCLPQEKLQYKHITACLLGFSGIFLLINNGSGFQLKYFYGYSLAFLDALVWAFYTLASRYYGKTHAETVGFYCGVGALFSLVIHCQTEVFVPPNLQQSLVLFFMGITVQGFAYLFWNLGVKRGNFQFLSVLSYATPIISVLLLVLFNMTQASHTLWFATILVSLAGVISAFKQKQLKNIYRLGVNIIKKINLTVVRDFVHKHLSGGRSEGKTQNAPLSRKF